MKKLERALIILLMLFIGAALYLGIKCDISPKSVWEEDVFVPEGTWTREGSELIYEYQLPEREDDRQWTLLLQTHWTDYEISSNDQKIYRRESQREGAVHLFQVSGGKTLTVRFFQVKKENAAIEIQKSKFALGSRNSMYRFLLGQNWYAAFFAVFALVLGMVSIGVGIYIRYAWSGTMCRNLISLGLYILIAGTWILTDSRLLLLVTQKTGVIELISFLTFFSIPLPLLEFTKGMFPGKQKAISVFLDLFLVTFFVYVGNYIGWQFSVSGIIITEHFLMTATIIFMLYAGIIELRKNRDRKLFRIVLGYFTFGICSILALGFFYRGNTLNYSVIYMAGIIGFIFFLIDAVCIAIYEQIRESEEVAAYAKMAYLDLMTGLGNRTAFLKEKDEDAEFSGTMAYIMLDANNLKKTNDTLGHQKGDELIIQIAECIKKVAGREGRCYRIGGDEFVITLKGRTEQEVIAYTEAIRNEIKRADQNSEIRISAAVGHAWTADQKKDLESLMHQADEAMYENKAAVKAELAK